MAGSLCLALSVNAQDVTVIYESDFENELTNGIPTGWVTYNEAGFHLHEFNEDGSQFTYNYYGGNPGGGGSRIYEGFSGDFTKALYWGSRSTTEGYAEFGSQVKDYIMEDGSISPNMPEGIALKLVPGEYHISFQMAAWKGEPTFYVTLFDLDYIVYATSKGFVATPNMEGVVGEVTGTTTYNMNFSVDKPGYYILRFTSAEETWLEYLLASVKVWKDETTYENPMDLTPVIGDGSQADPYWTRDFTGNGTTGSHSTNTWSTEANDGADGTDMTTPFIEHWVGSGEILSDQKIYQILANAMPGLYKLTIDARVYCEPLIDKFQGISMYFGDASLDLQQQTAITYLGQKSILWKPDYFTIIAFVKETGDIEFGFKIDRANFNWLAFKNTSLLYYGNIERQTTEALATVLPDIYAPLESFLAINSNNMNAWAVNNANTCINNAKIALKNMDADAMRTAITTISNELTAAKANVEAMKTYNAAVMFVRNINEKALEAASEETKEAYQNIVATIDNIDELTTEEITSLTNDINISLRGLDYLIIETTQAGELGNLVLDYVENFSDVKKLKVVGPINSTDMERIAAMTSATEIDLGEASGLTTLSSNIFQNNTTLERIILPNSLTQMNSYAFENCRALKYVYLPGSLQTGYAAFYNCSQLETVELGEGITTIRENMFSNCYRLKTVQFPSTLKIIEEEAFYNCYGLTNFTLPEGLTTIDRYAFYRSSINASVSVDYYYDENGYYQEVYVDNVSPTTLIFPWSLTSIGYQAFVNWRDLKSIRLNEGLVSIGDEAFAGNNVTSITLPSTLTQIGSDIFTNKDITVTSYAVIPPTETRSNNAVLHPGTLYVPNIAVKAYKQAKGWTNFNIVGFNYIPNDIVVAGELTLEVKNGAFAEAKPNMWLNSDPQNTSYSNAKYGALTVKGDEMLSMGWFNLIADANCYGRTYYSDYRNYRSYTTLINNASMRADNVNTRLYISSDQWFFFSFPYDVKVSDIIDAFGNAQWVIRKYDGEKRAAAATGETWVNVGEDDILEAYQGYIWQMGQRGSENWGGFDIPAINNSNKNNIFANADVEVTLAEYQSEFAHNRSWNLIGNPYPCYYDTRAMKFTAPITVWNRYRGNYEAYSPVDDSYILAPNEAFFVQRPIDQESIVFKKEGRQHGQTVNADASYGAKMRGVAARSVRSVFDLTLSDGENEDRTRVVFNEEAKKDYELDKDASKFMAHADIPQLFSLNKDVRYAINERPFDKGSVCLGYKVAANGTYTIAVNTKAKGAVMLEDTETGEVMNLSENAYSFSATAGTNESRFILHFSGEDATSIHSIDIAGKTNISELYTLDGRRLNGTVTTGVYLMKKGQTFQKVFVK